MKSTHSIIPVAICALVATLGSSCTHDEKIATQGPAITFVVTAPLTPKAAVNTNTINQFHTYVFANGNQYFDALVKKNAATNTWSYENEKYWPADGRLNFYSISPANISTSPSYDGEGADIPAFISHGQTDLLYAVNIVESKPDNGQVHINFRHALSQILVQARAKAEANPITVKVHEIVLSNIYTKGNFMFPRATTSSNIAASAAIGSWSDQSKVETALAVWSGSKDIADGGYQALLASNGYEFAIPQELTAYSAENINNAAYIKVLCEIYDGNGAEAVKIWPVSEDVPNQGSYILFPLAKANATAWEPGKCYRYNLTIGVPEGAGNKISFDVTVDEYSTIIDTDVESQ